MKIPLTKPYFDKEEEKAVVSVLRSGWVAQGPKVSELENLIAEYTDAKYAVATSSATTSLYLSLYIMGVGPGDEVILPSHTFIATANTVVQVGAKPVFVDIDLATYNIDPAKIEEKITRKTKAIMPVDQVGLPVDLDKIHSIAKKHKLLVLEDAACGLGSKYTGKMVGGLSDITVLSFHPRKTITTGEGGMILTNNKKWAERAKILRQHGMGISDLIRHKSTKIIHEKYIETGFNFRMSDIEAAVGVAQMKKFNGFLKERKRLAGRYTEALKGNDLIVTPFVPSYAGHNWQSYIIRLKRNKKIKRDAVMQKLLDRGISTRRGVMSIHLEKPYIQMFGKLSLPNSLEMTNWGITLPLYPGMKDEEQEYVIDNLLKIIK